jgi:hypothetical protein
VKKLLAKPPRDRYQTAREVLDALSKLGGSASGGSGTTTAVLEIAERARQHHDRDEARSLEMLKSQTVAEEETERNQFARQELVSLFDSAIAEINGELEETKITRVAGFIAGQAYQFGDRILMIWFFDRQEIFRQRDPGLIPILRAKNVADAGFIKIAENGHDREGWNIVHLRPPDAAYGEWKLLETRTNMQPPPRRIEPFAVPDAAFLGENLGYHWRVVNHSYRISEKPLETQDVYRILGLLVPRL